MASVLAEIQRVLVGVQPEELSQSMLAMQAAFSAIESTALSLQIEDGSLQTHLDDLTGQLKQTLSGLDQLLVDFQGFIEADSTLSVELSHTLREFGRSAQSVRRLAEYLERNPRALLSGRSEQVED
jgi:paraquat-inducible protein B